MKRASDVIPLVIAAAIFIAFGIVSYERRPHPSEPSAAMQVTQAVTPQVYAGHGTASGDRWSSYCDVRMAAPSGKYVCLRLTDGHDNFVQPTQEQWDVIADQLHLPRTIRVGGAE